LEEQRTRIAQELHDHLLQNLTVLVLELSLMDTNAAAPSVPTSWKDKVKEMTQLVNEMIQSVRRLKTELRPKVLDEFGLVAAIEWEADAFMKRTGTKVRCKAHPETMELPAAIATEVFRMFQELVSYIEKHADAQRVEVHIKRDRRSLTLTVSDDGKGIGAEQLRRTDSLGLLALQERTGTLGGQLDIQTCPGKGTTATLRVPIQPEPPVDATPSARNAR
jgi:signal transduction histidine kinase